MSNGAKWPRITLITPSFNQGQFLEEAIRSVLLQGYPNLEYFLFDGGSTDSSLEVIKKYSPWLTHWVSEKDDGQSEVINRGLNMASGLYAAWINSDDMLFKNALSNHALRTGFEPGLVYVGTCIYIDELGRKKRVHRARIHSLEDLVDIRNIWRSAGNIVQPEVFFPRELALRVGGLNKHSHYCMDYELWGKFFLVDAKFRYTGIPTGMMRQHKNQKTAAGWQATEELIEAATRLILLAENFSKEAKKRMLAELKAYKKDYWRSTGSLAKIGLPLPIVLSLRAVRQKFGKATRVVFLAKLKKCINDAISK